MILAVVLHAFRRRLSRATRRLRLEARVQLRKLSWRFHVRGILLPPWPNYGVPRVRRQSRLAPSGRDQHASG